MKKWLPEEPKTYFTASGVQINCLDDVPDVAKIASWQQRANASYQTFAIAPFVVVLIVTLWFFPNSTNPIWVWLIEATLLWAIAFVAYSFRVRFWGVHCPACNERFGSGDACRSCDLPRYPSAKRLLDWRWDDAK